MKYKGKEIKLKRYRELQKAKTISPIDRYVARQRKMYEPLIMSLLRRLGD